MEKSKAGARKRPAVGLRLRKGEKAEMEGLVEEVGEEGSELVVEEESRSARRQI